MKYLKMCAGAAVVAGLCSGPALASDFSLAPRTWLLFDSLSGGQFDSANGAQTFLFSSPPFKVFMKGVSATYRSDGFLPSTTFTLTGLYGKDSTTLQTSGSNVNTLPDGRQNLIVSVQSARQRLKRKDLEFSAQTRINDLVSWVVGVRYERARVRFLSTVVSTASNPFTGGVGSVTDVVGPFTGGYDFYSARAGVSLAAPLDENGTNLLFGNFLAFGGHRTEKNKGASPVFDNATLAGPDMTIGYTRQLGEHLAIDVRYRAIFFFSLAGGGRFSEPKTTHGPNVGVTYRF